MVATSFALAPGDLISPSRRSAQAAFARQVAMYLAHVSFGATFSAVGRAFGRDRTTAAHAVRVIEERRDDPRIDALLDRLEHLCADTASATSDAGTGAR
ncbi:MAG: helix-turn-helix domain-containing protein [Xanthobacteraceae bacterium]